MLLLPPSSSGVRIWWDISRRTMRPRKTLLDALPRQAMVFPCIADSSNSTCTHIHRSPSNNTLPVPVTYISYYSIYAITSNGQQFITWNPQHLASTISQYHYHQGIQHMASVMTTHCFAWVQRCHCQHSDEYIAYKLKVKPVQQLPTASSLTP